MTTLDLKNASITQMNTQLTALQAEAVLLETTDERVAQIEKEQVAIIKAIRSKKQNRNIELENIKVKIKDLRFTIHELFSASEIKALGNVSGSTTAVAATPAKPRKAATKQVFKSDANPIFIHAPLLATDAKTSSDFIVRQGRANETYKTTGKIFPNLVIPAIRCKGKDITETEKNLMKHVVDGDKNTYLKTESGKAEFKKIAKFIFEYVAPPKKAKKAKAA